MPCQKGGQPCGPNVRFPLRQDPERVHETREESLPPATSTPLVTMVLPRESRTGTSSLLLDDPPERIFAKPREPVKSWANVNNHTIWETESRIDAPTAWQQGFGVGLGERTASLSYAGSANPGINGQSINLPVAKATPNRNRKRTHDEVSESESVWSGTPLREGHGIRLLRLHGGPTDAPLQGRLMLSDGKETYEALSYAGVPEEGRSSIEIFSAASAFKITIKPNLEAALRQLRLPDRYRLLWIDSICIDQNDVRERNFHIQRMGSIFNTASNVCVWLGVAGPQSGLAFEFIRKFVQAYDLRTEVEGSLDRPSFDALFELLTRRWFTRRWALQEIALAKRATLYCGPNSISWADFADTIALLQANLPRFLPQIASEWEPASRGNVPKFAHTGGCLFIEVSSNIFRKSDEGTILDSQQTLESLVCNFSAFEASSIHDSIYTFLSLAEDTGARYSVRPTAAISMEAEETGPMPTELSVSEQEVARSVFSRWRRKTYSEYPVDYEKSPVDVCKDFFAFTVRTTKSLDILVRPWAPASSRQQLPSWVATLAEPVFKNGLHDRIQADSLAGPAGVSKRAYNASRKYPASCRFGERTDSKSLYVDGCILDSIQELCSPALGGDIPAEWRQLVDRYMGASSALEKFWRTLVANRDRNSSNPPRYFERACDQVFAGNMTQDGFYVTRTNDDHPRYVAEFLERVRSVIWMRRMIVTAQEHLLGIAPTNAQEGDLICIIFGCSVPVVLRKVVSDEMTGEHHYQLMGDCYVHGMMDGEAFTIQQARNIPQTQFELR